MSDDEDVMMDVEPIPTLDKGKGKALDPPGQSAPYGEDNLPWYASTLASKIRLQSTDT
jgi:hypothetical protein